MLPVLLPLLSPLPGRTGRLSRTLLVRIHAAVQLAAVPQAKQVPQASSCLKEMLHVGCVEQLLTLWRLAGCSCPWAGRGSLYQFHDISSAPKDIQQLSRSCRILPWSGQSCFASTETTRRQSSVHLKPCRACFAAGTWRGEMRDQRMLQQLMAGSSGAHPFCHLAVGVHGGVC